MRWLAVAAMLFGIFGYGSPALFGEPVKPLPDPRITSVYPFAIRSGTTTRVTIRGAGLSGARAMAFEDARLTATVLGVEQEDTTDVVRIEVGAAPGVAETKSFRLIATNGVSNELKLRVVDTGIADETNSGAPLTQFPVVVTGLIGKRGEVDTIWIEPRAGETLTFSCSGSTPAFDPSLALVEPGGSWFDDRRLNRIAFNDEPLYFPGLSPDARLVHRFEKGGRYGVQIRAFSGQGGPDLSYQLRIEPGIGPTPSLHPRTSLAWNERQFSRHFGLDWMGQLAARAGRTNDATPVPLFQASNTETVDTPVMTVPGIVEGRIAKPAETHRIRLRIDKAQDLAIEIETPEATMPRFNPVVRLMAPGGGEVVTNVYTKRNNNGLYMMKMIQAKSTFTLRSPGEYLMEIRDITTDVAADDFFYRILARPQIPHVGKIEVAEDHLNLEPGQSKPLTITMEREEDFKGLTLLSAEGLPAGVTVATAMANPVEKPPLPNAGRLERYIGKPQTSSLMLSASDDAAPTEMPAMVRVVLRTIVDGRQSQAIVVKEIPIMVIRRRPS